MHFRSTVNEEKKGRSLPFGQKKLKVYYPILQMVQRAAKLLWLKLAVTEAHLYDLHQTKESRLNTRKSVNTDTSRRVRQYSLRSLPWGKF